MENFKTKIELQQQKFVAVPEKEVEMLSQLLETYSNCLINDKITPYVSGIPENNHLNKSKNEKFVAND